MKRSDVRSDLELTIYKDIQRKIGKRKIQLEYETTSIPYKIEKRLVYIPDFIIKIPGRKPIYIEAKGYFRPADMMKMRLVKEQNPDLDIRMVFPQDNKVYRRKMRYSDWCKRYGFPYHIGTEIPEEWVNEKNGSNRRQPRRSKVQKQSGNANRKANSRRKTRRSDSSRRSG